MDQRTTIMWLLPVAELDLDHALECHNYQEASH